MIVSLHPYPVSILAFHGFRTEIKKIFFLIFIWLHQVLVVACGVFLGPRVIFFVAAHRLSSYGAGAPDLTGSSSSHVQA